MNVPIYKMLTKYSKGAPTVFHMPGHKLGKGLPKYFLKDLLQLDVTELYETDNLYFPEKAIKQALDLAALSFGSDKTYFLVNGSTCGIHTIINTICNSGDKIIVSRDCHKAVLNSMITLGLNPIYILPKINRDYGIFTYVDAASIQHSLKENPDVKMVLITSPTYYGICSEIDKIADIVHYYGKILAVDEAHGAHLKFSNKLPKCAMESGADICVQSAHKTLPSLTQSAYLHVKGDRVDIEKLEFYLGVYQTSSPSFIMLAFLDIVREIMDKQGNRLLNELITNIEKFNSEVILNGYNVLSLEDYKHDITRIVLNGNNIGISGFELESILRKQYNIHLEMADIYNIVAISTISDTAQDFEKLYNALADISVKYCKDTKLRQLNMEFILPQIKLNFKEVFNSSARLISIKDSQGKISKKAIVPYPPGVPIVMPGEEISADIISYILEIIKAGGFVEGITKENNIYIID